MGLSREKGEQVAKELGRGTSFIFADIEEKELSIDPSLLSDIGLIINTAGPFQRRQSFYVIEAALKV